MGGYLLRRGAFAGLILLMGANSAVADTYQPSNTSQTYPTLAEAEAAMRAVGTEASLLQFNRVISETATQIVRFYTVPNVDPIPYTYYATSSPLEAAVYFGGATREESCSNAMTQLNADPDWLSAYAGLITGYRLAISPFSGFENCGDWATDDPWEACLLQTQKRDSSICYFTMPQFKGTAPTCPAGYTLFFSGLDYTNSGPAYYNQTDPSLVYVCTNSTTATITQTCTDGMPQIKSLGANPQKPSRWLPANPPQRPNPIIEPSIQDHEISVVTRCGQVLPNADVTLNYSALASSGGHVHDDNRNQHVGIFELTATTHNSEPPSTGTFIVNTGATGKVIVKYVAPQASGQTKVTMTCALPDGAACESRDDYINVGIAGLLRLGAGINYEFIGLTEIHPDTRFGTPALVTAMRSLADRYVAQYSTTTRRVNGVEVTEPSKLFYNDMSLQWGGLLDCYTSPSCGGAPWKEPHASHRLGGNADVDTTSVANIAPSKEARARLLELRKIIKKDLGMKIYDGVGHGTHWHLTK